MMHQPWPPCCWTFDSFIRLRIRSDLESALTFTIPNELVKTVEETICHHGERYAFELDIWAVNGISENFKLTDLNGKPMSMFFKYSEFTLKSNNSDRFECPCMMHSIGENSSLASNNQSLAIFATRSNLRITFQFANRYHKDTCDALMANANIEWLNFIEMTSSLVVQNALKWKELHDAETLNSTVRSLMIEGYGIEIDRSLFAASVFGRTSVLKISGHISKFEPDVLEGSSLSQIYLYLAELRKFWQSNLDWPSKANKRAVSTKLQIHLDSNSYWQDPYNRMFLKTVEPTRLPFFWWQPIERLSKFDFNDQDFCLFYYLERNHLNVTIRGSLIQISDIQPCSCTLVWIATTFKNDLGQDYNFYQSLYECERNFSSKCSELENMKKRCEMPAKIETDYTTFYEVVVALKYANFWLSIVLTPLFSLLSFVANSLVVFTFRQIKRSAEYRKNKLKDKHRRMWDYVYLNSVFNLVLALVLFCAPFTTCIEYHGIFCSPLLFSRASLIIYVFVESFMGYSVRLMANMTALMFALFRYSANRDCWPKLRALRARYFGLISVMLSLAVGSLKLFFADRYGIESLDLHKFDYILINSAYRYNESLFRFFSVFNALLVSVIFPLITAATDIFLLAFIRRRQEEHRREIAEKRVTKMVILNGLFSLLFRLPEIIAAVLLIQTYGTYSSIYCIEQDPLDSICKIVPQYLKFFLSLSLLENFFMLWLFNPRFASAFQQIVFKKTQNDTTSSES
nr:G protein-coupled receptor [Proales similis]